MHAMLRIGIKSILYLHHGRPTQKASSYYRLECVCQCQETCRWRFCHLHMVCFNIYDHAFMFSVCFKRVYECQKHHSQFFVCIGRNEKNQLLLGIRRASRPQTIMPSSVLSSDSMHIGLLAAAAHAAATNSRFTIFYNPRQKFDSIITILHVVLFLLTAMALQFPIYFFTGHVHLSLLYHCQDMLKLCITLVYQLGCASECCLRLRSQVFAGNAAVSSNSYQIELISKKYQIRSCSTFRGFHEIMSNENTSAVLSYVRFGSDYVILSVYFA